MAPIITMINMDTELGTATIMSEKCLEERAKPIAADCMPVLLFFFGFFFGGGDVKVQGIKEGGG
jgi:hypothetical protein